MEPVTGAALALFIAGMAASGAAAGLLAGLFGVGGGAVMVPVLVEAFTLLGVDESVRVHLAVGTSLGIMVPTAVRSARAHMKTGKADTRLLGRWVFAVPAGVAAAALAVSHISAGGLQLVFATVAALVGLRMVFLPSPPVLSDGVPGEPWKSGAGFGIGLLSSLMGVGGGILNNIFMSLSGRPIHESVATSASVGVLISVPGALGFVLAGWGAEGLPALSFGYINLVAVAAVVPVSVFAAPVGARLAHALPARRLETAFGVFLLLVAARFAAAALD